MSELMERIRRDMNDARRKQDRLRILVLTTTLAELKYRQLEVGRELADADVVEVVQRAIKKRREAADQIRAAGREDMALKEEQEAQLLMAYMPEQLTEDAVRALVREAIAGGAKDVGGVMKQIQPKVKGRFDGRETNRIVREELG